MMKKLFKILTVLVVLFSSVVFAKSINNGDPKNQVKVTMVERNGKKSVATEEEYNKASDFGKRMINQIDASIAALDVLKDNEDNKDLVAIVSISKNKNDKFRNAILISKIDEGDQPDNVLHGSCKVCGIRSAYACLEKIENDDSLGNEFDVHVKRLGNGCIAVSW